MVKSKRVLVRSLGVLFLSTSMSAMAGADSPRNLARRLSPSVALVVMEKASAFGHEKAREFRDLIDQRLTKEAGIIAQKRGKELFEGISKTREKHPGKASALTTGKIDDE